MGNWLAKLRARSLAARTALLGSVVVALYVLVAPVAAFLSGLSGLLAAAAGGGLCLAGAALALLVGHLLRGPRRALWGLLVAVALRTGLPLVFGLALHLQGGPLAEGGILYYLLVFYPLTLGVETALSLPQMQSPGKGPHLSSALW